MREFSKYSWTREIKSLQRLKSMELEWIKAVFRENKESRNTEIGKTRNKSGRKNNLLYSN